MNDKEVMLVDTEANGRIILQRRKEEISSKVRARKSA